MEARVRQILCLRPKIEGTDGEGGISEEGERD